MELVLPGDRLIAYRIESGLKTRRDLCDALEHINMPIDYRRLGLLERSESSPTPYEIDAIRMLIGLSADCWLSGICTHTLATTLEAEAGFLNDRQIKLIMKLAIANAKIIKHEDT